MSTDERALALVDADSLYFRICYRYKDKANIRKSIRSGLEDVRGAVMAASFTEVDMHIAIKGKGNFRQDLYPEYKKNRKPLEEDMKKALNYAHSFMVEECGAVQADGMEADDLVSIWAHEARATDIPYWICGIDKDLLQIPGNHYNFVKGTYEQISEAEGYLRLMAQSLTGDSTDNIPGIKGIGPKKAAKILEGVSPAECWNIVRRTWAEHHAGQPELSYNLLRMLTSWEDYEDIKSHISGESTDSKSDESPLQEVRDNDNEGIQSVSE